MAELTERLKTAIEDKEVYTAIRVLFTGEEPGKLHEADRKAALLLLRTLQPDHLHEFLTTGKLTLGEVEILADANVAHKGERLSCIRLDNDTWLPRLDVIVAYYLHLLDDPERIKEIVLRHRRVIGRGVHFEPDVREKVEWAAVENAPYLFISGGVIAEVSGVPGYGEKALQTWCVLMRMRYEKKDGLFLIHGNGRSDLPQMWMTEAPRVWAFRISEITGISLDDAASLIGWMADPDATINNRDFGALVGRVATALGEDVPIAAPMEMQGACACGECRQGRPGPRLHRLTEIAGGLMFRDVVRFFQERPEEEPPVAPLVAATVTSGNLNENITVNLGANQITALMAIPVQAGQVIRDGGNHDNAA